MKNKVILSSLLVLGIVFIVVFILNRQSPEPPNKTVTSSPKADPVQGKSPKNLAPPPASKSEIKRINPQQRQKLIADILQKIAQAEAQRKKNKVQSPGLDTKKNDQKQDDKADSAPTGRLEAAYIKQQMREILPLVKECYENALAVSKDKNINGRIIVKFSIIGDPELGGVITKSELAEKDQSMPKDFQVCIRETMYALQLKAPKNGGQINVSYPFNFRSSGSKD